MRLLYSMAHPSDRLNSERAGHVVRPRQLLAALSADGHDVRIEEAAAAPAAAAAARSYRSIRSTLPPAVALTARDLTRTLQNERFARRLIHSLTDAPADVILETQVAFSTAGARAARRAALPLVLDDVSPASEDEDVYDVRLRHLARSRRRTSLEEASLVVVTSSSIRDTVVEEGVPPHRVAVIPNGVAESEAPAVGGQRLRAILNFPQDALVLAYVGSFQPFHRVDLFLQSLAAPEVPARVHALLIGDGIARAEAERLVVALGLEHRVSFTGQVPSDAVGEHLLAADVGVMPATADYTNPMKLYDYLHAGLPIVAPRQRAVTEIVPEAAGRLFEPGSAAALAAAIVVLATEEEARLTMAGAAAAAGRGHSWRARARLLVEEINSRS